VEESLKTSLLLEKMPNALDVRAQVIRFIFLERVF
jgi:hypothetical protein